VPERPEAWLLTTARNRLSDQARRVAVRADAAPTVQLLADEKVDMSMGPFPDQRLGLLFICTHPAIDPAVRTPLMPQTVLGLDAARIASAFCVPPATMGQRLVRLLVRAMPAEAEARGLLALMLHCEARRPARRAPDGAYVPLSEQDVSRWNRPLIEEAERELAAAAARNAPGRFQLEAAIQSVHAHRALTGRIEWDEIALLYDALVRQAPTLGAHVGRAAALGSARGAAAGLAALDTIDPASVESYQPYWAVGAHLLAELGRADAAEEAYTRAIGLSEDAQVRAFLLGRRG